MSKIKRCLSQSLTQSVTRSPIELSVTAKNIAAVNLLSEKNVTDLCFSQKKLIFESEPLENAFLKCMHPTHVERTHLGTLN